MLTFLNATLALLLPALLVAGRAAPAPPAANQGERQQPRRRGIVGRLGWAARKAGAAWAAADAQLAALCSGEGLDGPHQFVLAHGLLSLAWLISIAVGSAHEA